MLPNGNQINPREIPGKNLRERIDNWHKNKPLPQLSSNFVGAAERKGDYTWSDESETLEDPPDMTKREQEELQVLENLVASTQKKIDNTKRKFGANRPDKDGLLTRSKAQAAGQEKVIQAQPGEKSSRPDSQF